MKVKLTLTALAASVACLTMMWAYKGVSAEDVVAVAPTGTPLANQADSVSPCCPVEKHERSGANTKGKGDTVMQPVVLDQAPAPPTPARASSWLEPADREPFDLDFVMTDQDGRSLVLSELVGSPLAMSFIFTRCPNPNLCPVITLTMAHLQRDLETAGLAPKVRLLLMTYDPVYDTPQRLKKYGEDHGLRFTRAAMLRPEPDQFRRLLGEFQVGVDYHADGSIGHTIELLLIDGQGRFVRDYQGQIWDNALVLADLKRLVAEQEQKNNDG